MLNAYYASHDEYLDAIARETPDVVVTDLHMPEMDGLALVLQARIRHPLVPVVRGEDDRLDVDERATGAVFAILDLLNAEINKLLNDKELKGKLLDQGAEPQALGVTEFAAFVRTEGEKFAAIIKEIGLPEGWEGGEQGKNVVKGDGGVILVGEKGILWFPIEHAWCRVFVDGKEIQLTALEFKLLLDLATRRGRVQSRDALLDRVGLPFPLAEDEALRLEVVEHGIHGRLPEMQRVSLGLRKRLDDGVAVELAALEHLEDREHACSADELVVCRHRGLLRE